MPWITVGEVTKDNAMWLSTTSTRLTEKGAKFTRVIEPGTLLLTNSGATLGVPKISAITAGANDGIAMILSPIGAQTEFLYFVLQSMTSVLRERIAPGNGQPNLNTEIIGDLAFPLPPLPEQKAIADTLSTWDTATEMMERLIAAKESARRVQTSELVFGKARARTATSVECVQRQYFSHPIDWEYRQIGSFGFEISEKPTESESQLPVLSCSKYDGLVDSLEYFGKKVFSDDTSGYKVIRKGQFGYPSNHIEEGSIGLLEHRDGGLVSPIYIVFSVDADKVHPPFLHLVLKTDLYKHIFRVNTSSSVDRRGNLRWDEFSRIYVALPALVEQQQIVALVEALDAELTLLRKQLDLLKLQKRGLMQRLLTGTWRTKET